jgi:hypothetical protein
MMNDTISLPPSAVADVDVDSVDVEDQELIFSGRDEE